MSSIKSVPLPWCHEHEHLPPPRLGGTGGYNGDVLLWAGYMPPKQVELVYTRIQTGVATKRDWQHWLLHWKRVIMMTMRAKMGVTPDTGWKYYNGWVFTTDYVNERHESLFYFVLDRIIDLTRGENGAKSPRTSESLYFTLRYTFWVWKSQWELIRAGVGGIYPFATDSQKLGAYLVDYHYWRNKAVRWYGIDQPTVEQSYALLAGEVPEMLPDADELRKDRRPRCGDDVLSLWVWFNNVLNPHVSLDHTPAYPGDNQ